MMDIKRMYENIVGFYAYETGGPSFGIKDDKTKAEVISYINGLGSDGKRVFLSKLVREEFLDDEPLEDGYGVEDVYEFLGWYEDNMGGIV